LKKSITIVIIIAALVLLSASAIAMWSQTLKVNVYVSTSEVDVEFVNGTVTYKDACGLVAGYGDNKGNDWNATWYPSVGSKQLDKDVGCTNVSLIDSDGDGDSDTMNVTLYNVYPWYYTHIAFKIHNNGGIPVKIWRVILSNGTHNFTYYELNEQELNQGEEIDVTGDGKPDLTIWWGDNFGEQLHVNQSANISFDITVLQEAPQGSSLTFTLYLEVVQWNEYVIPP